MFNENSSLSEQSLSMIKQFGEHLPGGFFIYAQGEDGKLAYANEALCKMFGCATLEDFKAHTGFTLKGLVHPNDYEQVSEVIKEHLSFEKPDLGFARFRITRKDGQTRWVDAYGQFVGTAGDNGVHYVFVSDVTDKHLQIETDNALRSAIIEALTRVYDSLWLIDDVESQSFRLYRIDDETAHLLPAREAVKITRFTEAFAFYSKLVFDEDRQRFLEAVSPESIVRNIADKLVYSVPFRRVFESGIRHYRLEFAKLELEGGMGIAAGFKDVDEEVRKEQEIQQTLSLRSAVIEALTRVYDSVWLIDDVETQSFRLYRIDDEMNHLLPAREAVKITRFTEAFAFYSKLVLEEDRQRFLDAVTPNAIVSNTADKLIYSVPFRRVFESGIRHYRLEFAKLELEGGMGIVAGFKDVDEEVRKEQQIQQTLREAIESATASNNAKTEFMASMSHDMRTPMNGIIGMTAIAEKNIDNPEKVADCLRKIEESSTRLLALIDGVLDMNKIESGKVELHEEEFSLAELIDHVLARTRPQAQGRGHSIRVNIVNVDHERVTGDSGRIEEAFLNILSNAIKYTPDGGKITLSVNEHPTGIKGFSHYQFVFEDNGYGMTEEFLPHVFEPFARAEDKRISNIQGTGLGMAITSNILHMMGGDIAVESMYGKGSKITVNMYLRFHEEKIVEHGDFTDLTVLVVDDDPVFCESTCNILGDMGMIGEWVLSGKAAVNRVRAKREEGRGYFTVIVDFTMPDQSGIETIRQIREISEDSTPLAVLCAYDWAEVEQEAREAGANAFVSKPLFRTKLTTLFNSFIGSQPETAGVQAKPIALEDMDLAGRRILLAEDNELNAEIAMSLLEMTGVDVDWAEDGQVAVEKFEASPDGYYSMVIMDVRMPNMTGIEATKAIRALDRPYAKAIPIIAMTANAFADDVLNCLNAGMNEHLRKPVDVEALARVLNTYVN